jgi:enoyl-CoA hydratase/carnithine racemase
LTQVFRDVTVEIAEQTMTIRLNRPERLNAFTGRMKDELCAAIDEADSNDDVRVVVIIGNGRAFCAGADISEGGERFGLKDSVARSEVHRDRGGIVALRIFECSKPVIAAINGPAVGVGITMILAADIRIMAASARVSFVFTRRGVVPESCSTWFLPRLVGISRAAEWCYSGRFITSGEALSSGLVRSVHEDAELMAAARELAATLIGASAPVAVAVTRRLLWQGLAARHPMDTHLLDSQAMFALGLSPDADEGIAAFRQRRAPNFPLRVSSDMPALPPPM